MYPSRSMILIIILSNVNAPIGALIILDIPLVAS